MTAISYTKDDVMNALKLAYFTYKITFSEKRYTSYGGQPEEGIWYCNNEYCGIEWGDEHKDSCYDKTNFEAVESFIERGLR